MKRFFVFYAGLVYGEYESYAALRLLQTTCSAEIYNGAYVYDPRPDRGDRHWYYMDMTPVLDEDVPSTLKAWVLILT